jgi:hypothetical protein
MVPRQSTITFYMRLLSLLMAILIVFFVSCNPEPPDFLDNPTPTPGGGDSLLTRIETTDGSGSDSTIYTISYDAAKRIQKVKLENYDYLSGTKDIEYTFEVFRNGSGQITKTVFDVPFQAPPNDIFETNYYYESGKCKYSISRNGNSGGPRTKDSTVYSYNSNGTLSMLHSFYDDGSGTGYSAQEKNEYQYDGPGNITKVVSKSNLGAGGTFQISGQSEYTYDTKINPLKVVLADHPALSGLLDLGPNNMTKSKNTHTLYTDWEEAIVTYVYGADNKPKFSVYKQVDHPASAPVDTTTSYDRYVYSK